MKTVPGSSDYEEGFKLLTWEGLCHLAPATTAHDNPEPIVIKGRVDTISLWVFRHKGAFNLPPSYKSVPKTKFWGVGGSRF